MSNENTLASGHALTPETFADFVKRLTHHCNGDGVEWHSTADAMFTVQAKKFNFGIDREFTDKVAVHCDGSTWFSPVDYWNDCDDEDQSSLNEKAQEHSECDFLALDESDQWDLLGDLDDHTVSGWDERWDYVNSHFTKEAAEAFIKRKKHDYRDGLRVYVDAQIYCWEWNAIKEALINGRLVLSDKGGAA